MMKRWTLPTLSGARPCSTASSSCQAGPLGWIGRRTKGQSMGEGVL
jgi:hypothetical protein